MTSEEARSNLAYGINVCELTNTTQVHITLNMAREILDMLTAQDEVIQDLRKVGYPHNFQNEAPWIRNYMYAITGVIKKAVRLNNECIAGEESWNEAD